MFNQKQRELYVQKEAGTREPFPQEFLLCQLSLALDNDIRSFLFGWYEDAALLTDHFTTVR